MPKAKTILYLKSGAEIRLPDTVDELVPKWAWMQRSRPGSLFEFERVTGHGTTRRVFIPSDNVSHFEVL